ncbi:MAG: hypothetical protein L6Q45_10040 [Anaerolineales bacterium]|nr:hypothetical protein [Anaerolineales bacterium]
MPFVEVVAAQRISIMVSVTTVAGIGEQDITVRVVANPIATTFRFGQIFGFTAQPTTRLFTCFLISRF